MDRAGRLSDRELARFLAKVDRSAGASGCHPWTGSVQQFGYGRFLLRGRIVAAHRVAFLAAHGRWPEPCCLHRCDNRPCCNEQHLFEGTQQENIVDMDRKGRRSRTPGEKNGRAKLTERDVLEIFRIGVGLSQRALAARFGVTRQAIRFIQQRKTWAHLFAAK